MKTIKIENVCAKALKAANLFKATKDRRDFLKGVHFSSGGDVVGTDGSRLIVAANSHNSNKALTLSFAGTVPATAVYADIKIGGDDGFIVFKDAYKRVIKKNNAPVGLYCSVVSGDFPDYERITRAIKFKPVTSIGFNPSYMSDVAKACSIYGCSAVEAWFSGNEGVIKMRIASKSESVYAYVMPMRI